MKLRYAIYTDLGKGKNFDCAFQSYIKSILHCVAIKQYYKRSLKSITVRCFLQDNKKQTEEEIV